ncbi:MAG: peptidylprolyl isomerase [Candidatus Eremiobacteraeota bacterium]|nr:peptidylprolyl isomerase [Candidatus Eremiobacteraeota bacterium]
MKQFALPLALAIVAFAAAPLAGQAANLTTATRDRVEIDTSLGKIVIALDRKRAPNTVANFLRYVDQRFYNGGSFFRAVPGFVIQGGNKPRERPSDAKLKLETPLVTGVRNTDGAISMARTPDPDSATSEFFICDGPQASLDGAPGQPGYAAFGHVVSGMNVVRAIVRQPAEDQILLTPVRIVRVVRVR